MDRHNRRRSRSTDLGDAVSQPARTQTQTQNPYLPQPKPRFGKLAWTALILGIIGLCGSIVPILNNATAVAALVGLVLGIIALFGSRKALAGTGSVLCVLAVVATVVLQGAMVAELNRVLGGAHPAQPPEDAAPAPVLRLGFGDRHTWPDGRAISVFPPAPYEEASEFSRPPVGKRHVQFQVAVRNGGQDYYNAVTATIAVAHNGHVAQQHFGAGDPIPVAQLPPGGEVRYTMVFEIGVEPGELQVSVQPTFSAEETAYFVGQV